MRLALGLQTEKQSPDPKQRPEQRRPASMQRAPEPGPQIGAIALCRTGMCPSSCGIAR